MSESHARALADMARVDAVRAAHAAVMALEKWREAEHAATVARDIADAPNHAAVGELYAAHVRCCWGEPQEDAARSRIRELDDRGAAVAMTPSRLDEPPF